MPVVRICAKCRKRFVNRRINNKPGKFCSRLCADFRPFNLLEVISEKTRRNKDCLEWVGCLGSFGYGVTKRNSLVHRLVWENEHGPIPKGKVIRHLCNNPCCVKLSHLQIGTQADNIKDRDQSGRTAKGSRQGLSKLTEETIKEIRKLLKEGAIGASIARKFGVTKNAIYCIKRGETWKHLL